MIQEKEIYEGLKLRKTKEAYWLLFRSKKGKNASINLEAKFGNLPIILNAILGWADDVLEESSFQKEFQPEYYSGLNWRDAEKLVGKVVDYSNDGEVWLGQDKLQHIDDINACRFQFKHEFGSMFFAEYIRTCPQTFAHPTIRIGDYVLPMPEIEEPEIGATVWVCTLTSVYSVRWRDIVINRAYLENRMIHSTENRAQEWKSFWQDNVIKQCQEAFS